MGNCVIKWETVPQLSGQVKVYASTSPDEIPETAPVATGNIETGTMTIISRDPTRRYYYLLVFADKYRVKVATRNVGIRGVQNFRDLGGYQSLIGKKHTRWGMLYRSGRVDSLSAGALAELHHIGIKTIVDLRTEEERARHAPFNDNSIRVVHIPLLADNAREIIHAIQDGKIDGDTLNRVIEQRNRDIIANYQAEFKQVFEVLLDRSNYPVVIHCTSGKGRTGIVSALVLSILGVDEDIVMDDYRLSNRYFNVTKASRYGYELPPDLQEAITTIYSARNAFLETARAEIEREYGSVGSYLKNGVGLTEEEIKQLRATLLE